jgi:galactonate dehydratase
LEFAFGEVPWRAEVIEPPEALEHGRMMVSQRPGFGIELNEKTLSAHAA